PRSLEQAAKADQSPQVLHITDQLMNSPEGLAARAAFRELKAQGWQPPVNKSTAAIGDTMTFKVVNIEENMFENIDFKLMAEEDRFLVWVELAELDNGNVSDEVVDEVVNAMGNQTPAGSINPNEGVIVNDEQIFGQPPNVDGDGKSDILLVDVRDGYDPGVGGGYVVGFISPSDLPGRGGNSRDILYLDTNPSLTSRGIELLGETAAHEYQHLIHLNYDTNEDTWVNEGLAEWAEVANGYNGRTIRYLNEPLKYNVNLLRWSGNSSALVGDDYQRGGLFTSYIAERIGVFETGAITREPAFGADGYRDALTAANAAFSLEDLLVDFHIANFVNDTSLDPRYGYTISQRTSVQATPTAVFDARVATETPATSLSILPGAVQYYAWDQVTDLAVLLEGGSGVSGLSTTALLVQNGSFEARTVDLGQTTFAGDYDRIVLVMVNNSIVGPNVNLTLSADWLIEQSFQEESFVFDDGTIADDFPVFTGLGAETMQATRFVVSPHAVLSKVAIAPYFEDVFDEALPTSSRDYILTVWGSDENGFPGDVIFSLEIPDPPGNEITTFNFSPEIDLADYQAQLSNLPDTIFIGMANRGADQNHLILAMSVSNVDENNSFVLLDGTWRQLWDLGYTPDGQTERVEFDGLTLPIRASFLVPTGPVANEDEAEVPERIALSQNYPNPFNPTTTIAFALPQTAPVRLAVYDVLGREVAVLVDGVQPAGTHQVQIDARRWSSGMYFYTLEANGQQQTQRMVLVK
ncbi:MAG TPA: T9SS type A sorting domain-containing protein, partial [Rhodothermales bacterium]|nr:T9SS type A sorting domain-containing protein [Rhodothermales bacterium]